MLFGLIVYISIFKSEIGSKLRPRSQLQPPAFEYWYGYSFLLYVSGLIFTQLSGVSSIFLFIYRLQYEWRKKHEEEVKRGKRPPTILTYNQYDHTMFYPCRRHPQAYINSNSAIHFPPSPLHEKRYYFSKEPIQESPCSLHRPLPPPPLHSHSNSLKDVSAYYDFPPPPTISYQFDEHFNRDTLRNFPRDLTTNTVSTTADVVNCDEFLNEPFDDYSPSIQHEHEFVTFDLDQPLPIRAQSVLSINVRNNGTGGGGGKSSSTATTTTATVQPPPPPTRKTFESDTLRRTTPV